MFGDSASAYPNGAGATTELVPSSAPNWECVNDANVTTDTVNLWSDTAFTMYGTDVYEFADGLVPDDATISSVTVQIYCRKVDGTETAIANGVVLPLGGVAVAGTDRTLTTTWTMYNGSWATNPYTLAAWTPDDIDGLQIGVRLKCNKDTHMTLYAQCASVWVVVEYTTGGGPAGWSHGFLSVPNAEIGKIIGVPLDDVGAVCGVP